MKKIILFTNVILFSLTVRAAPPVFNTDTQERAFNSFIFVNEGESISFYADAIDPDGDAINYSATGFPAWIYFNTTNASFAGIAPNWAASYEGRKTQPGVFDITIVADDGVYFVTNFVTVYMMSTNWLTMDMRAIVTQRHLAAESEIGTPVDVSIISDTTRPTIFGGPGKQIRVVEFAFTSQVPDRVEMSNDWVANKNYAYLPVGTPAVQNAGALVEGSYAGNYYGPVEYGERACAELDIPIVVIDEDWEWGHGSANMSTCNYFCIETGDPRYLMYAYSSGHYMRGVDALVTIIDTLTTQNVDYSTFKVVMTGMSKFGQTCHACAAAYPERVVGYLSSGAAGYDSAAGRLLLEVQGSGTTSPEGSPTFLGCLMRKYIEMLTLINEQANSNLVGLVALGTDDGKNDPDSYTAKYTLYKAEKELAINKIMGCIPNAPHTMQTPYHSIFWRMLLAHCYLGRPLSEISEIKYYKKAGGISVSAKLISSNDFLGAKVWATAESDIGYISRWTNFHSYAMTKSNDTLTAMIPPSSVSFYIEVTDLAGGVTGVVTSSTFPINKDYPLLKIPPDNVSSLTGSVDSLTINLSWKNPLSEDFVGVSISRDTTGFPQSPTNGIQIFDGVNSNFTDIVDGVGTYYYSAFSYDALGSYSAGAFLQAEVTVPESVSIFYVIIIIFNLFSRPLKTDF